MLMIPHQPVTLQLRVIKERSDILAFYVRICTALTVCPHMDEASKLLEDLTVPQQQLPTSYHKFSLDTPLVDQVVDLVLTSVDPTLPLKSEVEVVNPSPSLVDPTLP